MVAIVVLKGREGGAEAVICEPTHSRYAEKKKKKKKNHVREKWEEVIGT